MVAEAIQKGYKRTEIGVIPEDWEEIGFVGLINKNSTKYYQIKTNEYHKYGVLPVIDQGKQKIVGYSDKEEKKYSCPKEGVIIFGDHTREIKFVDFDFIVGADGTQILTTSKDNSIKFYYYLLQTKTIPNTGYNRHYKFLKESILIKPNLKEQTAIVQVLSETDELIQQLNKLISKKKNIKKGVMQELLTGKKRLSGFSGEWEEIGFVELINKNPTKYYQIKTNGYHKFGVLPVIDQGKQKIVGYSDKEEKKYSCPKEGVIIFGDHTREIKFVDFDFIVGADGTQILTTSKDNSIKFYYYLLQTKTIPNTGYNRHYKFLKELILIKPKLEEQSAIAKILSDIDSDIEELEQKRNKYQMIKKGMMQQLLNGRIRLKWKK